MSHLQSPDIYKGYSWLIIIFSMIIISGCSKKREEPMAGSDSTSTFAVDSTATTVPFYSVDTITSNPRLNEYSDLVDSIPERSAITDPSKNINAAIDKICECLPKDRKDIIQLTSHDITIRSSNIADARASMDVEHSGKRIILCCNYMINKIRISLKRKEYDWETFSLLAHEVAHHALGHTIIAVRDSYRKEVELAADTLTGYICRKLGAKDVYFAKLGILNTVEKLGYPYPSYDERFDAITAGWNLASK